MEQDKELKAINDILTSLSGLDEESKKRAIKYVLGRLNVDFKEQVGSQDFLTKPAVLVERVEANNGDLVDIRTLKEEKKPKSSIQMVVLLAYYLKEKASAEDRKDIISGEDISKYFPQAGYQIPEGKNGPTDTLNNAKRSGYLESAGAGKFKLNAVGYNLAAFKMGNQGSVVKSKKVYKKKTKKRK